MEHRNTQLTQEQIHVFFKSIVVKDFCHTYERIMKTLQYFSHVTGKKKFEFL